MLSDAFFIELNTMCEKLGMNSRDLLLVMQLESGTNPAAKHPSGLARGIIQFMPNTLRGMGTSQHDIDTFTKKSAEEQLIYVEKYIKNSQSLIGGKPFTSATQYYHANFFPATLKRWKGTDPFENANVVVASKDAKWNQERAAYNANKGLDYNKDGVITVGDLTKLLTSISKQSGFQAVLKRLNKVAGQGTISELSHKKTRKNEMPQSKDQSSIDSLLSSLDRFLDSILKSASPKETNNYLIKITSASDITSQIEFARILALALKEEISVNSNTIVNDNVEMECYMQADQNKAINSLKEFCHATSNAFNYATKRIGGLQMNTSIIPHTHSTYKPLNIKTAEINYRKFHLKFVAKEIHGQVSR